MGRKIRRLNAAISSGIDIATYSRYNIGTAAGKLNEGFETIHELDLPAKVHLFFSSTPC
jgi:hypothetical protein